MATPAAPFEGGGRSASRPREGAERMPALARDGGQGRSHISGPRRKKKRDSTPPFRARTRPRPRFAAPRAHGWHGRVARAVREAGTRGGRGRGGDVVWCPRPTPQPCLSFFSPRQGGGLDGARRGDGLDDGGDTQGGGHGCGRRREEGGEGEVGGEGRKGERRVRGGRAGASWCLCVC